MTANKTHSFISTTIENLQPEKNETNMKVYYVRCVELIKASAHRTHVVISI